MKIGLTGSIACGKSTVSSYLRTLGCTVVDADAISHEITAPGGQALPAIYSAFGDSVFSAGGMLDRRALGSIVFADEKKRAQLNAILHPMIISEILRQLNAALTHERPVFGDIPLLYECGLETHFDQVWVVSVSKAIQIERLALRDGLTPAEAKKRIDAQMPLEEKERRADVVISTEGPIEDTQAHVLRLLNTLPQRRQA